jgi:hypothetical protein
MSFNTSVLVLGAFLCGSAIFFTSLFIDIDFMGNLKLGYGSLTGGLLIAFAAALGLGSYVHAAVKASRRH